MDCTCCTKHPRKACHTHLLRALLLCVPAAQQQRAHAHGQRGDGGGQLVHGGGGLQRGLEPRYHQRQHLLRPHIGQLAQRLAADRGQAYKGRLVGGKEGGQACKSRVDEGRDMGGAAQGTSCSTGELQVLHPAATAHVIVCSTSSQLQGTQQATGVSHQVAERARHSLPLLLNCPRAASLSAARTKRRAASGTMRCSPRHPRSPHCRPSCFMK